MMEFTNEEYSYLMNKLRQFFLDKGFIECHCQSKVSILSACENHLSIATFELLGEKWPMIQTGQMTLEEIIMKNYDRPGYFCITTSYREEKDPNPERHQMVFPMFEVEAPIDLEGLAQLETELIRYLGFPKPVRMNYMDALERYGVSEIGHLEEKKMYAEFGPVLLMNFPKEQSYWNMKLNDDGETCSKIDVILDIETIGSAEREIDTEKMRKRFYEISEGNYANTLFEKFGRERVERELEEYLKLNFKKRSGFGCGFGRLCAIMRKEGMLPKFE